jgi:hypothetical protein
MTQIKFNELPLVDKALLIAEYGKYLESVQYFDYWVHLYSINSQFIEVMYNCGTRQIDAINQLDYAGVDKYLLRVTLNIK